MEGPDMSRVQSEFEHHSKALIWHIHVTIRGLYRRLNAAWCLLQSPYFLRLGLIIVTLGWRIEAASITTSRNERGDTGELPSFALEIAGVGGVEITKITGELIAGELDRGVLARTQLHLLTC